MNEIEILTKTLGLLLWAVHEMNRGEVTQAEGEEMIESAMSCLYPLIEKARENERQLN